MNDDWTVSQQLSRIDEATNTELAGLFAIIRSQDKAIRELRVTVDVLSKMLIDAGTVDEAVLRARVEAGVEEVANLVECMSCHVRVPSERTQITLAGPVCDACTK